MSQKGNYTKKINKIAKINKAFHNKEHRIQYRKADKKVKAIPLRNRATKIALSNDLKHANGDLMHFLAMKENTFNAKEEYIKTINAFLSFEVAANEGLEPMAYQVGKMAELMEKIRVFHNSKDRIEELKKKIVL